MNERLRIPQDETYFRCLGLAAVAFARLEWDAVWCCERLQPRYIQTIEAKKKTAGVIGRDLKALFARVADPTLRIKIVPLAEEFCEIVGERNGLLHGKPGTSPNGEQRLFRNGLEWSIEAIGSFSDRCVVAGFPLNALLYGELKASCSVAMKA